MQCSWLIPFLFAVGTIEKKLVTAEKAKMAKLALVTGERAKAIVEEKPKLVVENAGVGPYAKVGAAPVYSGHRTVRTGRACNIGRPLRCGMPLMADTVVWYAHAASQSSR